MGKKLSKEENKILMKDALLNGAIISAGGIAAGNEILKIRDKEGIFTKPTPTPKKSASLSKKLDSIPKLKAKEPFQGIDEFTRRRLFNKAQVSVKKELELSFKKQIASGKITPYNSDNMLKKAQSTRVSKLSKTYLKSINKEAATRFVRSGKGRLILAAMAGALVVKHLIINNMIKKEERRQTLKNMGIKYGAIAGLSILLAGRHSLVDKKNMLRGADARKAFKSGVKGRWVTMRGKKVFIRGAK